jgi:hypothetical protein
LLCQSGRRHSLRESPPHLMDLVLILLQHKARDLNRLNL